MARQAENQLQYVHWKQFQKHLDRLAAQSGLPKKIALRVFQSIERWRSGRESGLSQTDHGENRIEHVVKYQLPDGYRLVVLEDAGLRTPLFVGSHDDTNSWLKNNKGSVFAVNRETQRVSFTGAARDVDEAISSLDRQVPSHLRRGLVFEQVPTPLLESLGLSSDTLACLSDLRFEDLSDDRMHRVLVALSYPNDKKKRGVINAITFLYGGRVESAIGELEVAAGAASTASDDPSILAQAAVAESNSDTFTTLTDLSSPELSQILASGSFSDWMLFLHPEQRQLVSREFNGAARLNGVAGSGKTSVLVHRANHLAKKYPSERVLVLTLNPSLVRLIEHLLNSLCLEDARNRIEVRDAYSYCYDVVKKLDPARLIESHDPKSGETLDDCWRDFMEKDHAKELADPLRYRLENRDDAVSADDYLLDELIWIRSGFGSEECAEYLTCRRAGRGIQFPSYDAGAVDNWTPQSEELPPDTRRRVLDLLDEYEDYMEVGGLRDHDGVALIAYSMRHRVPELPELQYRCVLIDEAQDFSTVQLGVVAQTPTCKTDGLFLCGDPAQKVFPKQHELTKAGIDVVGRARILRVNYRNTRQILEAADTIVRKFSGLAAIPESDILIPEYAYRDGLKPELYDCQSREQELELLFAYLEDGEVDTTCVCTPCPATLSQLQTACADRGITVVELTGDRQVQLESGLKISTLENVKGYEFSRVFVLDLSDSLLPPRGRPWEERWRDAFRIYVAMTRARDHLVLSFVYNRTILLGPLQDTVEEAPANMMLA